MLGSCGAVLGCTEGEGTTPEPASVVLTCDCTSITLIWTLLPFAMRLLQTDILVMRGDTLEGLEVVVASEGVEDLLGLPGVAREGREEADMMEVELELVAVSNGLEDTLGLPATDEPGAEEETASVAEEPLFVISEVLDGILDLLEYVSEGAGLASVSMAMDERRRD